MYRRIWLIVVPLVVASIYGETTIWAGGIKVGMNDGADAFIGHNGTNFYASGALGTVRSEPAAQDQVFNKSIGCWVDSTVPPTPPGTPTTVPPPAGTAWVTCTATAEVTDGNVGNLRSLRCVSKDSAMIAAVGAMNADSMITFETPSAPTDGIGQCVHIKVENISMYNAKAP